MERLLFVGNVFASDYGIDVSGKLVLSIIASNGASVALKAKVYDDNCLSVTADGYYAGRVQFRCCQEDFISRLVKERSDIEERVLILEHRTEEAKWAMKLAKALQGGE